MLHIVYAAMPPTKVLQSHGEPTPPAVLPWGLRASERLAHLPLLAQATRAVMPLHHAGGDALIP
jgi:hypothetical protein